jgi:hypothetical protein
MFKVLDDHKNGEQPPFPKRIKNLQQMGKVLDRDDIDARFNLFVFSRVFLYHLLFLLLIGPLTPLLMFIPESGFSLAFNMGFTFDPRTTSLMSA